MVNGITKDIFIYKKINEYASIRHVQKLNQVCLVDSTSRDFWGFYNSISLKRIFAPVKVSSLSVAVDLHFIHLADIDICINNLQVVRLLLDMFQIYQA